MNQQPTTPGMSLDLPPSLELGRRDVHVWLANIDQLGALMGSLFMLLDDAEREQAIQFKFEILQQRYIVSHGILRELLSRYTDADPDRIEYRYGEQEKPYLNEAAHASDVFFNMAHSGGYALFAFSHFPQTGVDIEKRREVVEYEKLVTRYFSSREAAEFYSYPQHDRPRAFFDGWSRKEAYIKAVGAGLSYPLDSFSVALSVGSEIEIQIEGTRENEKGGWVLRSLDLVDGYSAALAIQGDVEKLQIYQVQ